MKIEDFNKLTKEEQQEEISKCQSFEYFYNNYCKRDNMPDFSEGSWNKYLEDVKKARFIRRK